MKKIKKNKLSVGSETVRVIGSAELTAAAGGITAGCVSKPCTSIGCPVSTNRMTCTASEYCSYEC